MSEKPWHYGEHRCDAIRGMGGAEHRPIDEIRRCKSAAAPKLMVTTAWGVARLCGRHYKNRIGVAQWVGNTDDICVEDDGERA